MYYTNKHKVFLSYHHADQYYKNELIRKNDIDGIFCDASVDTGDIDDTYMSDQMIREKIRDEYLRDSTITVVLVGRETRLRKHVDWEIYSSMYDGKINKKSGILVVNLPTITQFFRANTDEEKNLVCKSATWRTVENYEESYPYMPKRIIDNFKSDVPIAVVDYNTIINNPEDFKKLLDIAFNRRASNNYDLSRPMRRKNN